MTGCLGWLRSFLHGSLRKKYNPSRRAESTPLAPLLGELSSVSETEGSPGLWDCQWGKELSALRPVFSALHRVRLRRPLSPVCALGTSPKRGSASRRFSSTPLAPLLGELSPQVTEGSPGLWDCQCGKEWAALRSVFSGLHPVRVRRPLSPVCALGTSPKRGSALRGEGVFVYALGAPLRGAVERERD